MKALELLRRELQNNYAKRPFIIGSKLYHKEKIEDYHEAIDELQDLQNRKCENCKYNKKQDNFMIYKYTVYQITPRGKHINVFEKVIQSKMPYLEVSDYLIDKYTGLNINVEEIKEIETIGGTDKRTYMSYEHMYEHYMMLNFSLDYSKDEEFKNLIKINKELTDLKRKFSSRVYNEIIEDPKYQGVTNKNISVELTGGYEKVTLSGEVKVKDLKLSEDNQ